MAPRTIKTPEQQAEQMQALYAQLDAQVAALATPAGWAAYLAAAVTLPRGGVDACLLIAAQRPGATVVASYDAWQAAGRQVRRGEKAIVTLASRTMAVRPTRDQGDKDVGREVGPIERDGAGGATRRISYPVRVFDISQTEPIKGAKPAAQAAPNVRVDEGAGLYARVAEHFARQSIALRRLVVPGCADGLCRKIPPAGAPLAPEGKWVVEVVVDVRRTGAQAARAAVHEAAHIAAGHLGAGSDYVAHRGRYEVEAQAAAFIVESLAGLETSTTSSGYEAGWMQAAEDADLKAAAAALAAARTLATSLGLIEDKHHAAPAAA